MTSHKTDAFQHGRGEAVHGMANMASPAGGEGEFLDDLPTTEQAAQPEVSKKIVLRRGDMLL